MKSKTCPQTKCLFNQVGVGCRKCDVCKCEPFKIDEDCDRCWNCFNDEGVLRWEDNEETEEETEKNEKELKVMEIRA